MTPVPMQCPLCAGLIQIDPAYAGQQVGCPLCQGVMLLPPPEFRVLGGNVRDEYEGKDKKENTNANRAKKILLHLYTKAR